MERFEGDNRTKKLIRRAFLECLGERGLEDVTVSMVAERAEVNRTTVYRYYESIFDILGDCIYQIAGKADQHLPSSDDPCFFAKIRETLISSAKDIRDNVKLYSMVHRYPSKFERTSPQSAHLSQKAGVFYRGLVDALIEKGACGLMPRLYLEDSLGAVSKSIIDRWAATGFQESPEEIADYTIMVFERIAGVEFRDVPVN